MPMLNINSMNVSQTVFALFFAILWGTLANSWPRWRAFDISLAKEEGRCLTYWRWFFSLFALNIVPFFLFIFVFIKLNSWQLCGPLSGIITKLFLIMLQPLSLVGIYWIWISILQKHRTTFYPFLMRKAIYGDLEEKSLGRQYAKSNFWWGLGYLIVPPTFLFLIT